MKYLALPIIVVTALIGTLSQASTTKYVVVEGKDICDFYTNSSGCYQQAMQMISSAAAVGQIDKNGKECVFPSGGKVRFQTDMSWMLSKQSAGDWNFEVLNPDGSRRLQFQKFDSKPGSGFLISGKSANGVDLRISFSGMSETASNNRIQGTVNCNMNFGTGDIVYIMNVENLYEAQRSCPATVGVIEAIPSLSYEYFQMGSKVQIRPHLTRANVETGLFTCRNY